MTEKTRWTLGLMAGLLLVAACAPQALEPPPPPAPPPPPPPAEDPSSDLVAATLKDVPIRYVGGDECVQVAESVEIYADQPWNEGKQKKVEWIVDDEQKHMYYWEIIYKGDGEDLIGPVAPIDCKKKKTDSKETRDVGQGEIYNWVYKVVVYECDENREPGPLMCETDPVIVIKGGP